MVSPRILLRLSAVVVLCSTGRARSAAGQQTHLMEGAYTPTPQDLEKVHNKFLQYQNRAVKDSPSLTVAPKTVVLTTASESEREHTRALVDQAIEQQGKYNLWRIAHPQRGGEDGPNTNQTRRDDNAPSPPELTPELLRALKLTNDFDNQELHNNGTLQWYRDDANQRMKDPRFVSGSGAGAAGTKTANAGGGKDWMDQQDHSLSQQPFNSQKDYKVWRNIKDYGAVGDGVTDDTAAIQKAISIGNRCGKDCPGSTTNGAIVFFPSGTYLVSRSIVVYYNTQLMGAIDGPSALIQSARNFIGMGVFTSNVYLGDGHSEWYLNTANFYRSIRGLRIDTRLTRQKGMVGIHWQVAQATTLEEISILCSNDSSTTQIGIFAENGSGGWLGDIAIGGGQYGILAGSQQYSASRIEIVGSQKCIGLIWNWVWSWSHLRLESCQIGIDLTAPGADSSAPVGSLSVVDSVFIHCDTAIRSFPLSLTQTKQQGTTMLALSHTKIYRSKTFIGFPDGASVSKNVDQWDSVG